MQVMTTGGLNGNNFRKYREDYSRILPLDFLLLMTVGASAFFALVCLDFLALTLLTAGHQTSILIRLYSQLGNHVLEFVRRLKYRDFAIRYRNYISGAWIARLSGLPQFDFECAKSTNLDIVAVFKRLLNRVKEGVNHDGNVSSGKSCPLCDLFN